MADLKGMDEGRLKELFDIRKQGHLDRLVLGIKKLQNPDQGEARASRAPYLRKFGNLSIRNNFGNHVIIRPSVRTTEEPM